jgi:hypothetical protein
MHQSVLLYKRNVSGLKHGLPQNELEGKRGQQGQAKKRVNETGERNDGIKK